MISTLENLAAWAERDRASSAISKPLWDANIQILKGDAALEYLLGDKLASLGGHSQQYATISVQRLLKQYATIADGIWATRHGVPHAKPITPRQDPYKLGKVVKYETAPGAIASPIVPLVDEATAAAYGTSPNDFWYWVRETNQPIAITEGLKKALALIEHGIPAISIRGITQWHLKGCDTLHPEIAAIATRGRKVFVIFDRDSKPKTIAAVHQQASRLGTALAGHGCQVLVPTWAAEQGKGVDDCLAALGENAASWLRQILDTAPTLRQHKRGGQRFAALGTIKRLNGLSFPTERETTGDYLPALPPLTPGAIHALDATMNTGKTYRIGRDWVKPALDAGMAVLVLSPLNSLGQQTAKDWGIHHIHDLATAGDWELVRVKPGVVLCPDSIGKLPRWFWDKPVLLVMDEANQVTEHICQGDTLKSKYAYVLGEIEQAAKQAAAIVLSEDGIPDRCVKFWQALSGRESVRVFRHRKQGAPWQVTSYQGAVSGFRARLLAAIQRGDRVLVVTASQREAKRLDRILQAKGIKSERKDSETNEAGDLFFRDPDTWLEVNQPQVLILSPSAKCGMSIQGGVSVQDAYFDSVWGYFPALATDTHLQLLGRYRPPVPRHVFVPPFILGNGDELGRRPNDIKERMRGNLGTLAKLLELENDGGELAGCELAILDYLSEARAVSGSQKAIAQEALINRLEAAGHIVTDCQVKGNKGITELWKATQEAIWQDEAIEIATAAIDPEVHTLSWARDRLDSMEASRGYRIIAHKVLWRDEFPGVGFDDAIECYQALCKDWGTMRRGVLLQTQAQNLDAVKASDRAAAAAILGEPVRAAHRLPKNYVRASILAELNVLALLDGDAWHNSDPRAIAIKEMALRYREQISYWLRLQVHSDQTPTEVVNKLLRKFGLVAAVAKQVGARGQQVRHWHVPEKDNPVRLRLLKASQAKLSGTVSTICLERESTKQIVLTTPENPPPQGIRAGIFAPGAIVRRLRDGAIALVEAIDGAIATLSGEDGAIFTALLSELQQA